MKYRKYVWFCDRCGAQSNLTYREGLPSGEVFQLLLAAHRKCNQACHWPRLRMLSDQPVEPTP